MENFILKSPRLGLRRWRPGDLVDFAAMNQDPAVMEFFPAPLSLAESAAMITRMEAHFNQQGFGLFAVEELASGFLLGFCGFMIPGFEADFTPCVEIGWRFRKEAWGRGLATEAARVCLEYGFGVLGLDRVYSFTTCSNLRSEKLMRRIGMVKAGEFDHPRLNPEHPLSRHVLYRLDNPKGISNP